MLRVDYAKGGVSEQRSYAETLVGLLGWVGARVPVQPQCSDFSLTDA